MNPNFVLTNETEKHRKKYEAMCTPKNNDTKVHPEVIDLK